MNCEQFLFEVSYLLESGESDNLGVDALAHADKCPQCHARFYQLKRQHQSTETPEFTPLMSQRLHQTIDLVIAQRRPSPKMWLQVAFTCLVLVGSLVGIAYQNHPTATPPVFVRR
jgi:hypothetical protein